jgi:hypothetical protein
MAGIQPERPDVDEEQGLGHQCFPLGALLLALNTTTVTYLSLDIEGAELQVRRLAFPSWPSQVLETLPWHVIDIEVISVEIIWLGRSGILPPPPHT